MSKNTSILLGDYYENFINKKIATGQFSSVSEVIRTALRLLESEESKTKTLVNELKKGEKSGFVNNFDRHKNLEMLHKKLEKK